MWSFDFAWNFMVPALVDPRFLARNQLMTTDNDNKLYGTYESQIPARFHIGHHRLCTFHGMTQIWPKNNITISCVTNGCEMIGQCVLDAIKRIVVSWTTDIESEQELQVSHDCLMSLLQDEKYMKCFDKHFSNDMITTVTKKIWAYRAKLVRYRFKNIRSFGTRTSNSSEVEGGILKRHDAGPKPNHSLATAAESTVKVSDMRITLKEQRAAKDMDKGRCCTGN